MCYSWNLHVQGYVHYMQNVSLQEGWVFPVEIILVAQVWKTLALYDILKVLFSRCIYVCSSCLQWDVSVKALSQKSIHPVSNMENAPIIFLPMSVGLNHEYPCQVAQSFWPKQDCLHKSKIQCDLAVLLHKVMGTLIMVECYWRSFPHSYLCFYSFHLLLPCCLSLLGFSLGGVLCFC